jgi:hypothetical protein
VKSSLGARWIWPSRVVHSTIVRLDIAIAAGQGIDDPTAVADNMCATRDQVRWRPLYRGPYGRRLHAIDSIGEAVAAK